MHHEIDLSISPNNNVGIRRKFWLHHDELF